MNYEKEKIKNALMFILTAWLTAMLGFTWATWGVLERRGVFAAYSEMEGLYLAATGLAGVMFAYYFLFVIPKYRRGERLEFTRVQRRRVNTTGEFSDNNFANMHSINSMELQHRVFNPSNVYHDS